MFVFFDTCTTLPLNSVFLPGSVLVIVIVLSFSNANSHLVVIQTFL
jgi:hypothetical protein